MKNMIYELYKAVDSVENQPYNIYDVYNTIKALGYDDDRVSSEFGLNSVCEVGDIIYEKLNNDKVQTLGRLTLRLLVKLLWALLIALPLITFAIAVFIMNIDFWRAQAVIKGTNLLSLRITLHINILAAHILFILAFSMTSYIISHSSRKEGININYKRIGATNLYDSLPFFLYCLFIFSSNLMITFTSVNGEYEIGASWGVITALIPMMLAGGLAGMYIKRVENQYNSTNKREFTVSNLKTFSVLNICLVIFSTILSCITMSVMMNILLRNSIILGPHYTSETYLIFTLVSCGYTFIASGLFNIAVLMYLNQSKYLVRLTSVSLGINTLGTFIISGFLVYPYIVLGLFISSIMFYLLSYYYCIKILDN